MHMHKQILNILTFQKIFELLELTKSRRFKKIGWFWKKKGHFNQNFAKQPSIFLVPEFLELIFTPNNTPPKVKNSKPDNITIFFGTSCRFHQSFFYVLQAEKLFWDSSIHVAGRLAEIASFSIIYRSGKCKVVIKYLVNIFWLNTGLSHQSYSQSPIDIDKS